MEPLPSLCTPRIQHVRMGDPTVPSYMAAKPRRKCPCCGIHYTVTVHNTHPKHGTCGRINLDEYGVQVFIDGKLNKRWNGCDSAECWYTFSVYKWHVQDVESRCKAVKDDLISFDWERVHRRRRTSLRLMQYQRRSMSCFAVRLRCGPILASQT